MRPRKLNQATAIVLLKVYEKVKVDLKSAKTCNQFQVATKLKNLFYEMRGSDENYQQFKDVYQQALLSHETHRQLSKYFNLAKSDIWNVANYITTATPAAIVQMVKREKGFSSHLFDE